MLAPSHFSLSALQAAAPTLRVDLSGATISNPEEITPTIEQFAREPNGGLIVYQSSVNSLHRDRIIALRRRLSGEDTPKEDDGDVALAIAAAPKQKTTVRNWRRSRRGP